MFCHFCLQNEARKLNQQEVVEEDKKRKLPANWEAKKARLEWEVAEDQKKKVTLSRAVILGLDTGKIFSHQVVFFQYYNSTVNKCNTLVG